MNRVDSGVNELLSLRVGERVRVKNRQDILATLDQDGMLDRLPFMPEIRQYCGRECTVFKRADKTCDTKRSASMHYAWSNSERLIFLGVVGCTQQQRAIEKL